MAEAMTVNSISEAYVKAIALATVERAKVGSAYIMANRLGISINKMKSLETLKVIDPRLLDAYLKELGITFKGKIEL